MWLLASQFFALEVTGFTQVIQITTNSLVRIGKVHRITSHKDPDGD